MLSFLKLKRKRKKSKSDVWLFLQDGFDLMAFSFVPVRNLIPNATNHQKLKYKVAVLNILYLQLSLKAESSI